MRERERDRGVCRDREKWWLRDGIGVRELCYIAYLSPAAFVCQDMVGTGVLQHGRCTHKTSLVFGHL